MAISTLVDLVKIYATTTGSGTITLGAAVDGYRGIEALANNTTYSYSIVQNDQYEAGQGTYIASGNLFVRSPSVSSSGGAPVPITQNAIVNFTALAQDIGGPAAAQFLTTTVNGLIGGATTSLQGYVSQAASSATAAAASATFIPSVLVKLGFDLRDVSDTTLGTTTPSASTANTGHIYLAAPPTSAPMIVSSLAVRVAAAGTGRMHFYAPDINGVVTEIYLTPTLTTANGVNTFNAPNDFSTIFLPVGSYYGWEVVSGGNQRFVSGGTTVYDIASSADTGIGFQPSLTTTITVTIAQSISGKTVPSTIAGRVAALEAGVAVPVALDGQQPTISYTIGATDLSKTTGNLSNASSWFHPMPAERGGPLKRIVVYANTAGAKSFGFAVRNGDGTFSPVGPTITLNLAVGLNQFAVGADFTATSVKAGWYFGALLGGVGVIKYSGYAYMWRSTGTFVASSTFVRSDDAISPISSAIAVTGAFYAEIATPPVDALRHDLTRKRVLIYKESFSGTALPSDWRYQATSWTANSGLVAASGTAGYGATAIVDRLRNLRLERRTTRVDFTMLASGSALGVGWLGYDGDGDGPSLFVADAATGNIIIKNEGYAGAADPGNAVTGSAGFALVNGGRYRLEIEAAVRTNKLTLTDLSSGKVSATISEGDTAALTDKNKVSGAQNAELCFVNIAGQTRIDRVEIFANLPPPRVYVAGDSITQGAFVKAGDRWASLLYDSLGGSVAISSQAGSKAEGCFYAAFSELPALKPNWLVFPIMTNDNDSGFGPAQVYVAQTILMAKRYGTKLVMARLLNRPGKTYDMINAWLDGLAATDPDNFKLWRWDLATTVNNDGVTQDTTLFNSDNLHPNAAGHLALFSRLRVDAPQLWD